MNSSVLSVLLFTMWQRSNARRDRQQLVARAEKLILTVVVVVPVIHDFDYSKEGCSKGEKGCDGSKGR